MMRNDWVKARVTANEKRMLRAICIRVNRSESFVIRMLIRKAATKLSRKEDEQKKNMETDQSEQIDETS